MINANKIRTKLANLKYEAESTKKLIANELESLQQDSVENIERKLNLLGALDANVEMLSFWIGVVENSVNNYEIAEKRLSEKQGKE